MNKYKFIGVTLMTICAIIVVIPFLWALSVSLQGPGLAYVTPPVFFKPPYRFENFAKVMKEADFFRYSLNSILICSCAVFGATLVNAFVGFGFAKFKFKGSGILFAVTLATMMVPANIMSVPVYIIWSKLGFLDTYVPLILPAFLGSAFWVFFIRQSFMSIPNSFFEAASIDGANPVWIFFRIYCPLCKPAIATVAFRAFLHYWNDYQNPLIYLSTKDKFTIQLGLAHVNSAYTANVEIIMAGTILAIIPAVLLYMFAQKYFVEGVVSSGVKG